MGELVNVLVAFAVIIFLFRWATSGNTPGDQSRPRSPAEVLGFRPKNVTQEMITTISNMFPDIPTDNIRFDLLRSGSVEVTTNKILERGYLEAPPAAYYTLYPRTNTTPQAPAGGNAQRQASQRASEKQPEKKETLISKFNLENRITGDEGIKKEEVGGKAIWEDTAEKREASLKERKAKMILAARQRLLTQQQKDNSAIASTSGVQS
ncbi:Coupling of ubiquitin conjugation to ER degradation protein 1 [Leucoagaricus sp. SymC.cos]|nr:Coupling of ubiquitin conjugation to ER degradation protein 1 [Leucoagaricus sp. SymC.cos]